MTDAPKQKAYMVSAAFGLPPDSVLFANACIAPSGEAAVAMCVALFCQESGTKQPIQGINCMELTEGFMSAALTAIRGGDKSKVVSLREVEKEESEPRAFSEMVRDGTEPLPLAPTVGNALSGKHIFMVGPLSGVCATCGFGALHESHYPTHII